MSKHVLLGVTGSIAAFKAVEIMRQCQQKSWEVSVVMTRGATQFVTELTFRSLSRRPVAVDLFAPTTEWRAEHIALADWADVFLVAPCTANVMAKLAHGIADDLLTCTALACTAPLVIAPAMNDRMWLHAATQANAATLRARGVRIVEVETGALACGEGKGRLAGSTAILEAVDEALAEKRDGGR